MIWETTKILESIDKTKWKKMTKSEKMNMIIELQILIAINYLIHLHLSKLPINKQLKLLLVYYEKEPLAFYPLQKIDVIELFFRFQPLIPVFLYINYIVDLKKTKNSKRKLIDPKKSKSKSKSMKGGYLFMLTSRGEKPIRGVDMENFLTKMDESVETISYLPSSGPPNIENGEVPNTYNGFALLYYLARNQPSKAMMYSTPFAGDYLNIFSTNKGSQNRRIGSTRKYTDLLRSWSDLQKEAEKSNKKQSMNEEFMGNYEKFVKQYMGQKEFREKHDDYQQYLEQMQKYKEKNNIETKLFDAYNKAYPAKKDFVDKYGSAMSTLDHISMIAGMIPSGS